MDNVTIERLKLYYKEMPWLKALLAKHESSIDYVSQRSFSRDHLEWKIGHVNEPSRSFTSAVLVDDSTKGIVQLGPRCAYRLTPFMWALKLVRIVDPVESWTIYGALRRLRDGSIHNPHSVLVGNGKWLVIMRAKEVTSFFPIAAHYEVRVAILKVKTGESLLSHMAEYDQSIWHSTNFADNRSGHGVRA